MASESEIIKGYKLTSTRKLRDLRAEGITDEDKLLAAYDKKGGAIFDERGKVPMGTFSKEWEFDREGYTPKNGNRKESDGHKPLRRKEEKAEQEGAETKEEDGGWSDLNASEAAYELAQKNGIDLIKVKGTGKDGRILLSDVKALL